MGYLGGVPVHPGRDVQRPQGVRACTVHRTIGRWPGDLSVGTGRVHSSPGTFPLLIGQAENEWAAIYWTETRCSHAAGGNYAGPGIELSGGNGEWLTDWQLRALAWCAAVIHAEFGVPLNYYDGEFGRIWLDQHPYRGFISHRAITYPPNTSFNHYDFIFRHEWDAAMLHLLAARGGEPAAPPPAPAPAASKRAVIKQLSLQNLRHVRYTMSEAACVTYREEVQWWQRGLNLGLGTGLVEDGKFCWLTAAKTIDFQRFFGVLPGDGVVGNEERNVLADILRRK